MPTVRDLRVRARLTQQELAQALGIAPSSVFRIEAGAVPRFPLQRRIAAFFAVDPNDVEWGAVAPRVPTGRHIQRQRPETDTHGRAA